MKKLAVLMLLFISMTLSAQQITELNAGGIKYPFHDIYKHSGFWITNPDIDIKQYSVVLFRKNFKLDSKPANCIVHISADNLYRLYINGKFVCMGPARDDYFHWNYETIDVASLLHAGENVIAVQVNNFGHDKANAQFSWKTGFILSAQDPANEIVNSDDKTWKTTVNKAYRERPVEWMNGVDIVQGWYCINPNDSIIGADYPWGWEKPHYDDSQWKTPEWLGSPNIRYTGESGPLLMQPRSIRLLDQQIERFASIARTDNRMLKTMPFNGTDSLVIPENSKVTILIDHKKETMGFPRMIISGGNGSTVKVQYAEALYDKNELKGNRNDLAGKRMIGVYDIFLPGGQSHSAYEALWYRAFRFIRLEITTGNQPLVINDFYNLCTHYPFEERASFTCDDPDYTKIWDAGWRTDLICSQDLYMSDAYYETMQYVGDTRVHGIVTAAITGDYSLYRQAIRQFDQSRIPDGLTLASYPNDWYWIIPYYSLMWVDMVKDYTMLSGDSILAAEMLPGVRDVLAWFNRHISENGLLGNLEWANPNGAAVNSSLFSLYYAYSLGNTALVCDYLGLKDEAAKYREQSRNIASSVYNLSWDKTKNMLAETPEKTRFTIWDNIMGILTGVVPEDEQPALLKRILALPEMSQFGYFTSFYLFEAIKKLGMGNDLFDRELDPWREQVNQEGLTTFKEINSDRARSDCHPWSTSPLYYMLNIAAGIETVQPGFTDIRIAPAPGNLRFINASMPVPSGIISIDLQFDGKGGVKGTVSVPENTHGVFVWREKELKLKSGVTDIKL